MQHVRAVISVTAAAKFEEDFVAPSKFFFICRTKEMVCEK
jgi:hypothetical protein